MGHCFRRCRRADYGCFCGRVQRFQRRGKEENRLGVQGTKCNMTIGKMVGEMYTNYMVESMKFAGYLP